MRLLLVEDNATIGEALLQSVFDRLFRLNDRLNDIGSGLGLGIVKPIADRHDIALKLSQSERHGSLPIALNWPLSKPYNPAVL